MNRIISIAIASLLTFGMTSQPAQAGVMLDHLLKRLRACRWFGDYYVCKQDTPPSGPVGKPGPCVPVCSPDGQWCKTCDGGEVGPFDLPIAGEGIAVADGDVVVLRGHGWHAEVGEDAIAWCVEPEMAADGHGRCGFNPTPTTFGCQYFPEEGPADDLMVCILTILDGMCGGCISGCQGNECGEEE